MNTMDRPLFEVVETVTAHVCIRRVLRASALAHPAQFRVLKQRRAGVRAFTRLKHDRLSAKLSCTWQVSRTHSSWSRA